ncbi:hypothetical protein [Sinorhizobium fredii]|uniref:hypothetical protein n=1 Tax=Rhizobium fredii TaxID=380 RepID=UPI0030A90FC0
MLAEGLSLQRGRNLPIDHLRNASLARLRCARRPFYLGLQSYVRNGIMPCSIGHHRLFKRDACTWEMTLLSPTRRRYPLEQRPISPAEVAIISQAFDQLLEEYRIPPESEGAEALASRLFTIYQNGVHDIDLLKKIAIEKM